MITLTRRTRFQACISFSPGRADAAQCQTMTAKQFAAEYHKLHRLDPNASIFVDVYRNGQRVDVLALDIRNLADGVFDELTCKTE